MGKKAKKNAFSNGFETEEEANLFFVNGLIICVNDFNGEFNCFLFFSTNLKDG